MIETTLHEVQFLSLHDVNTTNQGSTLYITYNDVDKKLHQSMPFCFPNNQYCLILFKLISSGPNLIPILTV